MSAQLALLTAGLLTASIALARKGKRRAAYTLAVLGLIVAVVNLCT